MLIEFAVSNYRSFRERQVLSMVGAPRIKKQENLFDPELPGEPKFPKLLKVAVIYGPNGAGKSNLLKALNSVVAAVKRNTASAQEMFEAPAFAFDQPSGKASEFELHFICHGMRYQYILHLTPERVTKEELSEFPHGNETLIYGRRHNGTIDEYEFGSLEGDRLLHETWRKITGPRITFLSQAVANSNEEYSQLRKPYQWLSTAVTLLLDGMQPWILASQKLARKPEFARNIADFLDDIDIPISEINVTQSEPDDPIDLPEAGNHAAGRNDAGTAIKFETRLIHKSALGTAQIPLKDVSDGTRNLMGFWIPWTVRSHTSANFKHLRNVLIVDELDNSLHPSIVTELVRMHIAAAVPGQLIFTTHGTHLMDSKILRRDQVWVAERDRNGATSLRSIHDFEGRESEDIERRYFRGFYRGLPMIRNATP